MASAAASPTAGAEMKIAPSRQFIAGLILAISNFMVVLDLTIANVSIPHIAGNLGITLEQGAWIITSYAVAEAVCVPLTGWLALRFGVVRMFVIALMGFGLFSLLCGLSVSLSMLVVCRIGQGIFGAPLMPMSQTLMLLVFPPEKRGTAVGIWAMTTLLGPALGPIIGGWISDSYSWHWIFLLNVPIAVACTAVAWALLRPVETQVSKPPIDMVGMLLLVFWIGSLQVMLDIGRDHGWFEDSKIVALAIMAVLGLVAFVIWELTDEHPAVDLRIFRHRGFAFGVVTLALAFGSYFASIVVVPQWLQTSLGYSATDAGVITALTAFSAISTAPFAAKLMERIDPRWMISLSVAFLGVMTLVRTGWTTGADYWALAVPQVVQGFAMPFFIVPLTAVALSGLPPSETASGAGLQNFMRTMAVAVSTSLALTIWGNAQRIAHNDIANVLNPGETVGRLEGMGIDIERTRQVISGIVDQEATMLAVNHTFFVTAITLFIAAALVWIAPRPQAPGDLSQVH